MSAHVSPPKRPRLSLQTKPVAGINSRASRASAFLNPADPTTFNTLSNAYAGVVDRSHLNATTATAPASASAPTADPLTAINTNLDFEMSTPFRTKPQSSLLSLPSLPLSPAGGEPVALPMPSTLTSTPPLSAGPIDNSDGKPFSFAPSAQTPRGWSIPFSPTEPRTPRRLSAPGSTTPRLPYTHPLALHSILRNSPLPASSSRTPSSPRRQSLRLQEKAAKRVGYNNPLTQTITTNKYTKSHIDLLAEDASPYSPVPAEDDPEVVLDLALAYTANETRDGGMTPGPFEEMRRRMAGLGTETPSSPAGIRKRKRKEKKRCWVWTLGPEEAEEEEPTAATAAANAAANATNSPLGSAAAVQPAGKNAMPILRIKTPKPPVRKTASFMPVAAKTRQAHDQSTDVSESESVDVVMSDTNSSTLSSMESSPMRYVPDSMHMEVDTTDTKTPTAELSFEDGQPPQMAALLAKGAVREARDSTPIPAGLVMIGAR